MHPPFVEPHRQYNGQSARLKQVRSWVLFKPLTINFVFVAYPLTMHYCGERAKNGLAWNQNNVSEWSDMSKHYKSKYALNTKEISFSSHQMQLVLAMIQLTDCSFGVKQQSLTHSLTSFVVSEIRLVYISFQPYACSIF